MRGRFAVPVHDPAGILLAYCGRAVKDESPLFLFPNGFDPRIAIFNANRIVEGDLSLSAIRFRCSRRMRAASRMSSHFSPRT